MVRGARVHVLDECDSQRTASVLVSRELGCEWVSGLFEDVYSSRKQDFKLTNGGLGGIGSIELDNTSAAGTTVGLILDFGAINFADGGEQVDQVVVASGPRQLFFD